MTELNKKLSDMTKAGCEITFSNCSDFKNTMAIHIFNRNKNQHMVHVLDRDALEQIMGEDIVLSTINYMEETMEKENENTNA